MPYLLLLLLFLPLFVKANNHALMPLISFHLKQKSLPGYGLNYRYQYNESFEFDLGIIQSGDLEILQEKTKLSGHYTSILFGTNFLKHYNNDLTIKAGLGLTYTTASSNHQLIKNNQAAPYIKLSAKYRIGPNLNIELGQTTQFNSNQISTNHNVFLGIAWSFGATKSYQFSKQKTIIPDDPKQKIVKTEKVTLLATVEKKQASIINLSTLNTVDTQWYIQLAAYQNIDNANQKLLFLQQLFDSENFKVQLRIVNINDINKLIIVKAYTDKSNARAFAKKINTLFSIEAFITTLTKPEPIKD